jgi:predicted MPP superfamily phosphohydrolase
MNKKGIICVAICLLIVCILVSIEMAPTTISTRYRHSTNLEQDPTTLRFNKDDTFTIVQFADLHYGESVEQDSNSTRVMLDILKTEKQIDFAAFTGDQVSGYARQYNRDIFCYGLTR